MRINKCEINKYDDAVLQTNPSVHQISKRWKNDQWGECDVASIPDDGVLEAQFVSGLLDLLYKPGLRPHEVLDKLGDPPDGWVTMQAVQAWRQVFRDCQW